MSDLSELLAELDDDVILELQLFEKQVLANSVNDRIKEARNGEGI